MKLNTVALIFVAFVNFSLSASALSPSRLLKSEKSLTKSTKAFTKSSKSSKALKSTKSGSGSLSVSEAEVVQIESVGKPGHYLATKEGKQVFTSDEYFGDSTNNSRNWKIIPVKDDIVQIESVRFPGFCLMTPGGRVRVRFCDNPKVVKRKWKMIMLDNGSVVFESVSFGSYLDDGFRNKPTYTPVEWKLV